MTNLEHRAVKISFFLVIAISAGFLGYSAWRVAKNGDQLAEIRMELESARASGPTMKAKLETARRGVNEVSDEVFMTDANQAEFLGFLKSAVGNGAEATVHIDPREDAVDGVGRVSMRLGLKSDFPTVVRYLSRIENYGHYFFVTDIDTTAPYQDGSSTGVLDTTIDGYAYWR